MQHNISCSTTVICLWVALDILIKPQQIVYQMWQLYGIIILTPHPTISCDFPRPAGLAYRHATFLCSLDVGNLVGQLTITGLKDLFGHNPNKWNSTNDTVFMFMTPYPPISWRCMSPGLLSPEVQLSPRPGTGGRGRLTCRFSIDKYFSQTGKVNSDISKNKSVSRHSSVSRIYLNGSL